MNISVVIPAYNEEKFIRETIMQVYRNLPESEIIVVSDGSIDNTANIVKDLQNKIRNLIIIELKSKCGKGAAILKGFEIARRSIIGFLDADDAFKITSVKKMINLLKSESCDCVIASKWKGVKFSQVDDRFFKKVLSRVWNILVKLLFHLNFEDTQGGSKFLKRKVLRNIGTVFHCQGFEIDVELLVRISKAGYIIKEVFMPSIYRKESKFRMSALIPMFIGIMKLKLRGIR